MADNIVKVPSQKETASQAVTTLQETADRPEAACQDRTPLPSLQLLYSGRPGVISEAPRSLRAGSVPIGRVTATDGIILADDDRVSRLHAVVRRDAQDVWRILDKDSKNGVFVNGVRIRDKLLQDGDLLRIGNSFLMFRLMPAVAGSSERTGPAEATSRLLGTSPAILALRRAIAQAGPTDSSVLLLGESGTGKELSAEGLHQHSMRARGPFVAVNCAEVSENLAESLLFGHEKGAFTGADRQHDGYFRSAHRGTLFLDELTELPRSVQAKLLRALEKRQVTPVGATRAIDVDVRIIAATNGDLVTLVNQDAFRGDLFFRLADLTLRLPPLRERREDILPILLSAWSKNPPRLSPALVEALLLHRWPYNVRELLKIARELQVHGQDARELDLELVADRLAMHQRLHAAATDAARQLDLESEAADSPVPTREELLDLLRRHDGNISRIAREKSRSRAQVHRWLAQRGVDRDRA